MYKFEDSFDKSVNDYEESRPLYVKELYDDIFKYKEINADSDVLEIGIGTGKATLPILKTNCHVAAIEPGGNLTEVCKEKYKGYNNFSIYNTTLQEYECPAESFDLIYSATAFHWIPEEYGYKRVYELLKKGGVFSRFAYHAGSDKKRPQLTHEIQELYKKYMHQTGERREYSEDEARSLAELAAKYGFVDTKYKMYSFTKDFTADEYMKLLHTYSDHMRLEEPDRNGLLNGIYDVINRHGGVITVYYTIDLQLARKL